MLLCPLSDILLWVRIWVKRFSTKLQDSSSNFLIPKTQEKVLKSYDFRTFYGCGGRTRTYDLRVMSPTSYQLLYSAIFTWHPQVPVYNTIEVSICQALFSVSFRVFMGNLPESRQLLSVLLPFIFTIVYYAGI